MSPDLPEKQREIVEKLELTYTLLSDSPMSAARTLGLAFEVDPETLTRYAQYGLDLEGASGQDHHQLPVPTVLILDTTGKVQFVYSNVDHRVRIPGDLVLAAAKSTMERSGK